MKSAKKLCEKKEGNVGGKTTSIIDTPGLFNMVLTKQQLTAELQKCVVLSAPGPHVFLLVLKLGVRFTKEERDTVKWIQESFGEEALSRTIILFTHADQLKGKPMEDYINKSSYLMEIVESCGGRYHSFNNEDRNYQDQVTELLKKVDTMMEENEMSYYNLEMFKTTQMKKVRKRANTAFAVAVLGFGVLGTIKILGKIFAVIAGSAAGAAAGKAAESAIAGPGEAAGEAVDKVLAVIEKVVETAGKIAANKAVTAVEKAVETAGETVAIEAVAAVEKAVETAGETVAIEAVAAVEKAVETVGETVAIKAVAAVEKAIETAGKTAANKAVEVIGEAAGEAVQTVASGTGAAAQGICTGLVAVAAAAAARSAAAAGKVATSGRISAVAAVAAAFGGAAVALISALK